jgi:hypothetical protein
MIIHTVYPCGNEEILITIKESGKVFGYFNDGLNVFEF